jgi:hypothetical protein
LTGPDTDGALTRELINPAQGQEYEVVVYHAPREELADVDYARGDVPSTPAFSGIRLRVQRQCKAKIKDESIFLALVLFSQM